jgi:FkbM family methyltransferase
MLAIRNLKRLLKHDAGSFHSTDHIRLDKSVPNSKPYQFGRFTLEIPADHKIEEIHKIDLLYDRNFSPIIEAIGAKYPSDTIVDIGANIGDTAAYIRTHCSNPLLCVEGGELFLSYLRKNIRLLGDNIKIVDKFVMADSNQNLTFDYASGAGTGALSAKTASEDTGSDVDFITTHDLMALQNTYSSNFCLVKSDTDGFDGPILSDIIARLDTNLYFECDPNALVTDEPFDWARFFKLLEAQNYSIAVFDNFGLPILFSEMNYAKLMGELLHYVGLQRTLRRISIYYYDVWAFRPQDFDIFQMARRHYKP